MHDLQRELGVFSLQKRRLKGVSNCCHDYLQDSYRENGDTFWEVNSKRGNRNESQEENSKKKIFTVKVAKHQNKSFKELVETILASTHDLTRQNPEQPDIIFKLVLF